MNLAPIILFVYNRPEHTKQTVDALEKNLFASESLLFVYSDGPKNEKDKPLVEEVRNFINKINGFKDIKIILRQSNLGLADSIVSGVTEVIDKFGKAIVLEDDIVTSPYFLKYMNDALEFYSNVEQVISIHGYTYPVDAKLPQTFFLRGADCWGWATWKRGWELFERDAQKLLNVLTENKLLNDFDWNGALSNVRMLKNFIKGKNNSWAIRWHASAFIKNKLTLYPGVSLVRNIGADGLGTNVRKTKIYDTTPSTKPILVNEIPVVENEEVKKVLISYFLKNQSLFRKLLRKLRFT